MWTHGVCKTLFWETGYTCRQKGLAQRVDQVMFIERPANLIPWISQELAHTKGRWTHVYQPPSKCVGRQEALKTRFFEDSFHQLWQDSVKTRFCEDQALLKTRIFEDKAWETRLFGKRKIIETHGTGMFWKTKFPRRDKTRWDEQDGDMQNRPTASHWKMETVNDKLWKTDNFGDKILWSQGALKTRFWRRNSLKTTFVMRSFEIKQR